jgi:N-dimethylarginine dimethylaminohydrolase
MGKPQSTIIMSPPDYFDIEYSINPWMSTDNKVHPEHAKREWERLKSTYESFGFKILTIPAVKGLPDLVFTTDHGKWIDDTLYVSHFRYEVREKEQIITLPWYREHKIKLHELPPDHFMEGGDVLFHHDLIFVGHGYRTSANTADFLQKTTGLKTISLKLIDDAFYHLDTCFFPVKDTAFYYPTAFATESIKALRDTYPLLIPLTSAEAEHFACNSVELGDYVLCQPNPTFEQKLIDLSLTPLTLEMHEFNKSGGGIHCLSQMLFSI